MSLFRALGCLLEVSIRTPTNKHTRIHQPHIPSCYTQCRQHNHQVKMAAAPARRQLQQLSWLQGCQACQQGPCVCELRMAHTYRWRQQKQAAAVQHVNARQQPGGAPVLRQPGARAAVVAAATPHPNSGPVTLAEASSPYNPCITVTQLPSSPAVPPMLRGRCILTLDASGNVHSVWPLAGLSGAYWCAGWLAGW